jgi:hypothetical protein
VRINCIALLGVVVLCSDDLARADETTATSKIVAVDLFKNGLAVVRREVMLGKSGVYILDDVPEPVHGTYWVESAAPVETAVQMREVEVAAGETSVGNLQEDLAGKKVTIQFKGGKQTPVVGTIAKLKPRQGENTFPQAASAAQAMRFLVVETPTSRIYVDTYEIATVATDGADATIKRRRPRFVLTLGNTDQSQTPVRISYLAHGLGWAPAYKLDITDPKTLVLEQQAVVKNELSDLKSVEINLISGFPSVQFANVMSPLSARSNWATFFQEVNQRARRDADIFSNSMVLQQSAFTSPISSGVVSPVSVPAGEGVDLHYESIGKRTLAEGDALSLTVARGKADYERIVEWLVPDTRDEWGRYVQGRERSDETDDSAWDALKFKNPLSFPMTTGPALVTAAGRFNGQRTSTWANAGEETVVRVDKALSIRTRSSENEQRKASDENHDLVWIGGRQYRKSIVEGELAVSNHRAEVVRLVIRRRFSGELLEADGKPKTTLREEGVYSVNRRSEMLWNLPLQAGENRVLKYRYSVLVAH